MGPKPPSSPALSEGIDFIARDGYFEARHAGTYSEAAYKTFVVQSLQSCIDAGRDLLFVDISALSGFHPNPMQRYEMGRLGSQFASQLTRVAVFGTPRQIEDQFGALVAQNRGLNIRAFVDREEALRWLLNREVRTPTPPL
jgi:hypothetical protein